MKKSNIWHSYTQTNNEKTKVKLLPFLLFSCSTKSLFAAAKYFNYKNIFNWPKQKRATEEPEKDRGFLGGKSGKNNKIKVKSRTKQEPN